MRVEVKFFLAIYPVDAAKKNLFEELANTKNIAVLIFWFNRCGMMWSKNYTQSYSKFGSNLPQRMYKV